MASRVGLYFSAASFVAGAATMVIEIAAARVLAPLMGVSLYSWTSVIGVILAGLAAGSWLAGAAADRWRA
ncbi:MAG: hypothetical protein EPO26_11620 [Chloroflexota bacterium]|nr:MAG: hypothetical protein EPO26_11620 [Chloroflexota bacterium]